MTSRKAIKFLDDHNIYKIEDDMVFEPFLSIYGDEFKELFPEEWFCIDSPVGDPEDAQDGGNNNILIAGEYLNYIDYEEDLTKIGVLSDGKWNTLYKEKEQIEKDLLDFYLINRSRGFILSWG